MTYRLFEAEAGEEGEAEPDAGDVEDGGDEG